jgi:flagellin
MSSDVVLTAALRNNLLSLQGTQKSIDSTQLRLATGRKVNSALDNPQNFFASQALNNRASDLQRLLDGIGQNIQVIKAADNGVTALTRLVEQADSVAQNARDALAQGQSEAKVTGTRDLRGVNDLTNIEGIDDGFTIHLSVTDENGEAVNIGDFGDVAAPQGQVTINTNDSIDNIIDRINNLHLQVNNAGPAVGAKAFEAKLDEGGQLQIRTLNGGNFRVVFEQGGTDAAEALAFADALGFGGGLARAVGNQTGDPNDSSIEFTVLSDVALRSVEMFRADGASTVTALRSTLLSDLIQSDGATNIFENIDDEDDQFQISINGGELASIQLVDGDDNAITVQGFIDAINTNGLLNSRIRAEFDDATGQMSIRSIDASVKSIQIGLQGDNGDEISRIGFGLSDLIPPAGDEAFLENILLGKASSLLAQYESEYDSIRNQMTELVSNGDTGYRGTNLLNGDDLGTFFNEFRTSSLTTKGVTFTADGLGLERADFARANTVDRALSQVREALESVRNFGSTLANDLAVIQTREDFTNNLINTLQEGSDKLTVADQNAEGAKLLALQTRQQLGVTSLSLASQSQQSILRLF